MRQPIRAKNSPHVAPPDQRPAGDGSMFSDNAKLLPGGGPGERQQQAVATNYGTAGLDTEARIQRERLEGITDISDETREVKLLFEDFNTMVQAQQAGLDAIETNVDKSGERVEGGVQHLKKASEVQKSSRRWMCGIIVCVAVCAAIGVIVAVVVLKK